MEAQTYIFREIINHFFYNNYLLRQNYQIKLKIIHTQIF